MSVLDEKGDPVLVRVPLIDPEIYVAAWKVGAGHITLYLMDTDIEVNAPWNLENRFTCRTDVDLSEQGIKEGRKAGNLLKTERYVFDMAFTSVLKRAVRTLWIVLDEMDLIWIPLHRSWRLNERHYGALQGLNKRDMTAKFGLEQVQIWRRGYSVSPPAVAKTESRHPGFDSCYANLKEVELPCTESLKDTLNRVLPYWNEEIVPRLREGTRILISAHGNSLRALMKHLESVSDKDIVGLDIPTGIPLVYELDNKMRTISHYYLGEQEKIEKAQESVASQISGTFETR